MEIGDTPVAETLRSMLQSGTDPSGGNLFAFEISDRNLCEFPVTEII
jgi:hypothetical protein